MITHMLLSRSYDFPPIGGKQFWNKLGADSTLHADAGSNHYRDNEDG